MTLFSSIPRELKEDLETRNSGASRRDFLKTSGLIVVSFGVTASDAGSFVLATGAEGVEQLAVSIEVAHAVGLALDAKDLVTLVDEESVSVDEDFLCPGFHEGAIAIEQDERMIATVVDVDPVFRIHGNGGNPAQFPAVGV